MMKNEALRRLVESFVAARGIHEADRLLDAILWEWTCANDADPAWRGEYMDARVLISLEQFVGLLFRGTMGRTPASVRTHDPSQIAHAGDPPLAFGAGPGCPHILPGSAVYMHRFTGAEWDLPGGIVPSPISADILMTQYYRLRAFIRAQLHAQSHLYAELRLRLDDYDPRRWNRVTPAIHLRQQLAALAAAGRSARIGELYCTLSAFEFLGGYQIDGGLDAAFGDEAVQTAVRDHLRRARSGGPGSWMSDDPSWRPDDDAPSLGCVDLLRGQQRIKAPSPALSLPRSAPPDARMWVDEIAAQRAWLLGILAVACASLVVARVLRRQSASKQNTGEP
ncbi:MAG: hypothetical protein IT530_02190 [Burkholderiales bacterium]|nr:hypothetical protein [Burkholderiales bacterium]